METLYSIIASAKSYLPTLDEDRVIRAYEFAAEAHKDQKRFSGEPYIIHPLEVAQLLLEYHPDENTIIGALLHDVAEDTPVTLDEIEEAFGSDVRGLCEGMMKLSKVRSKLNDPQVENLRKLFLAMAKDFRVVLIKLCDRLHNMGTLQHVRPDKQTRIAQETLYIYAPIASRLGIYRLKSQLEELCFAYLAPTTYKDIQQQIAKTDRWREQYIDTARRILLEIFAKEGIQARIDGRVKSLYSIFRKMQRKNKNSITEIFDVFAMRVILPDIYKHGTPYIGHLYTALGILHNHFTPLSNRFKDYIAVPKVNGYRSLHTTLVGLGPKDHSQPTEIQIRTETMHQEAEYGVAAHWIYEEQGVIPSSAGSHAKLLSDFAFHGEQPSRSSGQEFHEQHQWITSISEIGREIVSNQELLENLRSDTFQDRIFVLTPRGDVKDLPHGATPIDFAYAVHTEIGNHCTAARVNGTIVPLDYELKSGEVVDITTRKNAAPNQQWLSFVKTNHARNRIRAWFRSFDEEKHLRHGRKLMNEKLRQWGKAPLDVTLSALKHYDQRNLTFKERRELLCEIGRGAVLPSAVLRKIFSLNELLEERQQRAIRQQPAQPAAQHANDTAERILLVAGQRQVPYHFVQCCDASTTDELVGYITRGRGVSIHIQTCPVIRKSDPARIVPVRPADKNFSVKIGVHADDRIGMLRDISNVFAKFLTNIIEVADHKVAGGISRTEYTIDISNLDQLEKILAQLEKIPNVRRAFKVN
ncbi:(p)ppGpp synthetase [Candidatus Peregrinibacteria bacterium CG11_big_fil_rev_8_21_14_0_20_46_8]|nr:MAG: (p)ppGpp synthetase [Candidatus Peregrinibacteria bacterium CG11_big_fil_rev_8_21_14_0_20_46_8]